ncbi:MAG: hypothetical protein H8K05_00050 [Nitrospira sp.]|nr:hypothetical protein [Nitrospira sp.]
MSTGGLIDMLGGLLSFIYNVYKDVRDRRKKPDPVAIIEQRRKGKGEFEKYLHEQKQNTTEFGNVIIRDISRMDLYPDLDAKAKGISPWFKPELKGLYHRGFEVILRIEPVKYEEALDKWYWSTHDASQAINALIVGRIPYDVVKAVEWKGDQYYRCPHIYCEFSKAKKQP